MCHMVSISSYNVLLWHTVWSQNSDDDRNLHWHKLGHTPASHVDKAPLWTCQAVIHHTKYSHTHTHTHTAPPPLCLLCVGTTSSQCHVKLIHYVCMQRCSSLTLNTHTHYFYHCLLCAHVTSRRSLYISSCQLLHPTHQHNFIHSCRFDYQKHNKQEGNNLKNVHNLNLTNKNKTHEVINKISPFDFRSRCFSHLLLQL